MKITFPPENEKCNQRNIKIQPGYSTPYTLDGSVLIVNPDLTKGMNIEGYSDLIKPELKGKIATADPANSSSAFAQLTNMLQAEGGYADDKAWTYVKDLFTLIMVKSVQVHLVL